MEQNQYEALKSNDEEIWSNALEALTKEHSLKALNALIETLSDRSWRKREIVANSILKWGDPKLSSVLVPHLKSENIDKFYWILRILGNISDELSVNAIKPILNKQDAELRGYAVQALGKKKQLINARALYPMLNDSNWSVRKLAFTNLLEFGDMILDDLRKIIITSYKASNHNVVALFIKIGKESVLPELHKYYSGGSFSLRYAILSSIGEIGNNDSTDFLIKGLSDNSWAIRLVASEQLLKIGPKAFDRLTASFGKSDSIVRHEIINILVSLLAEKAMPFLTRLLSAPDQEHKMLAIENLSRLKSDEATNILIKTLSDNDRIVSDYAAECLVKKTNLNINLLLNSLSNEDENLRFQIIKIIGSIGGFALTPIIKLLDSSSKQERLFLLSVLQKINPNETLIDKLVELLGDEIWPIRQAAANCLYSYSENAVSALVVALNNPSDDVKYWANKVLTQIGPRAIKILTEIMDDGTDPSLIPHIISALLSMSSPEAVPAVIKFIEENDDYKVESIFSSVPEIKSKDVANTILGLLTHPDERVTKWLSKLLYNISSQSIRRSVFLGLSHSNERARFYVIKIIGSWKNISENDMLKIARQLPVEKSINNIRALTDIIAKNTYTSSLNEFFVFLEKCDKSLMLNLILEAAQNGNSVCLSVLSNFLNKHSELISEDVAEQIGKILSFISKDTPEGLINGLQSKNKAYKMCCIIALESANDIRIAKGIMDKLASEEDIDILHRAVKALSKYLFSDNFMIKSQVTEFMLELGKDIITKPLSECLDQFENAVDRKAIVDLVESVGGVIDPSIIRGKSEKKVMLSDSHLDEVLEKRKQALEELERYDELIKETHTMDLTIMFTDIKGFTAFSSKSGLSDVMSMLKQHDEILKPVFKKYGGDALKKIGDAFLVVFENHNNALLAGIEIQRQLQAYNATALEEHKLAVRIAINSGPVIRLENDVMGDSVNLASRVEGIADAFEIVITEFTLQRIDQSVFEIEPYGEHTLKGISRPIKAYKVKW